MPDPYLIGYNLDAQSSGGRDQPLRWSLWPPSFPPPPPPAALRPSVTAGLIVHMYVHLYGIPTQAQANASQNDELCVRAIMAVSCQCTCDNCSAKGLCEPWLVVPHLCKLSARDWQRAFEPHASKNRTLWCHRRSPSPKLYIPILVISSVLKRCIREMMLASAFLLFQTM